MEYIVKVFISNLHAAYFINQLTFKLCDKMGKWQDILKAGMAFIFLPEFPYWRDKNLSSFIARGKFRADPKKAPIDHDRHTGCPLPPTFDGRRCFRRNLEEPIAFSHGHDFTAKTTSVLNSVPYICPRKACARPRRMIHGFFRGERNYSLSISRALNLQHSNVIFLTLPDDGRIVTLNFLPIFFTMPPIDLY